jgi:type IV pilus assembly protein PilB
MREIDFRVSCLPTLFGEKIVLRLLDRDNLRLDMTKLGFDAPALAKFESAIRRPWGMVLVTGPTGSGKTNTLYSSIMRLNQVGVNILTAEDPVEFNLPGINQVHVREQIGMTFAAALRSFLRQDPNVILVGEIRDLETAAIAVKAALTGHLVLSTLHTNDAPTTVNRLVNMGIEPFLVANSVNLVCAQRLVRRICENCKTPNPDARDAAVTAGMDPALAATAKFMVGKGCERCGTTGYRGRVGLFEVMEMTDAIRQVVLDSGSAMELRKQALIDGMVTLRQNGLQKVHEGLTTVDEVARETVY